MCQFNEEEMKAEESQAMIRCVGLVRSLSLTESCCWVVCRTGCDTTPAVVGISTQNLSVLGLTEKFSLCHWTVGERPPLNLRVKVSSWPRG